MSEYWADTQQVVRKTTPVGCDCCFKFLLECFFCLFNSALKTVTYFTTTRTAPTPSSVLLFSKCADKGHFEKLRGCMK